MQVRSRDFATVQLLELLFMFNAWFMQRCCQEKDTISVYTSDLNAYQQVTCIWTNIKHTRRKVITISVCVLAKQTIFQQMWRMRVPTVNKVKRRFSTVTDCKVISRDIITRHDIPWQGRRCRNNTGVIHSVSQTLQHLKGTLHSKLTPGFF